MSNSLVIPNREHPVRWQIHPTLFASCQWSPHRQEPVAPFKNATSREFRIPPPAGAGGFQFAGIR
jgi:hypothetical protein